MSLTTEPELSTVDDYRVTGHVGERTRPVTHHVLSFLNILLLIILAATSFALFWVVMVLLGAF